ncbi:hypothetical protein LSTR_LSTR013756 [Laodelphax striatellus]|uniref:Uncharacterized protein n=1 Tax=Laodelphax striatellus TaxID=195883 RepID=A0A482WKJ0_LAOST|nr:hypothetical protein LSTR_LSTR013756 [Laodelphax striatellus]
MKRRNKMQLKEAVGKPDLLWMDREIVGSVIFSNLFDTFVLVPGFFHSDGCIKRYLEEAGVEENAAAAAVREPIHYASRFAPRTSELASTRIVPHRPPLDAELNASCYTAHGLRHSHTLTWNQLSHAHSPPTLAPHRS